MDKLVYDTIHDTPVVVTEVAERIFGANVLGVDGEPEHPPFPWIAINELPSNPFQAVKETSNATAHTFSIYVYDELGDGTRINRILNALRDEFKQLSGVTSTTGVRCTDCEWQGTSGLIPDREYSANVKFCTIRIVANQ